MTTTHAALAACLSFTLMGTGISMSNHGFRHRLTRPAREALQDIAFLVFTFAVFLAVCGWVASLLEIP